MGAFDKGAERADEKPHEVGRTIEAKDNSTP
jgi:hypothetical protein